MILVKRNPLSYGYVTTFHIHSQLMALQYVALVATFHIECDFDDTLGALGVIHHVTK